MHDNIERDKFRRRTTISSVDEPLPSYQIFARATRVRCNQFYGAFHAFHNGPCPH
jgi:hypothetical protein